MANDEVIDDLSADMEKALTALKTKLGQMRTGRASLGLLDSIRVDYYGNESALHQVATLAVPEPQLITISPWEKTLLGAIEKAIQKSGLGLNPQNDGKIIRVPVPALTGERRKELVKQLGKEGEASKVALRGTRREYIELIKGMEKDKEISEDDSKRLQTRVQETTDKFIAAVDQQITKKEREINEV